MATPEQQRKICKINTKITMTPPKQAPQTAKTTVTTLAGELRRARGDRPSVHDARRAAFIKQVVATEVTTDVLRNAQILVHEVRAASSASFLDRYRQVPT